MAPSPAAGAWVARLRAEARKLADGFRRSDRFFKMRLGVVAAWGTISVITLFAACPSGGVGNSLGAEAQFLKESFVGGAQVLVRNDSDEVWTDVVLTLDGEWRHRTPTIRSRSEVVVPTAQFLRGADPMPPEHRPRRLEVECSEGSHTFELR